MIVRSTRSMVCACLVALVVSAVPAVAQITTGNVLGSVKDSSGGVVPGATVVLVSEARGTKSVPAVTNATGDYVFPNITPDTYTVEVTMDGFRTVRRASVKVTGGDRVTVPALTLEPGGAEETVTVTSEAPLIQASSGERSFAIPRRNREPADQPRELHRLHRLHAWRGLGGASAGGTRLGGVGQNNIMMDGISAMDTGNNGQMLNMNIESIAEVKVLTQGYQAEYGRSSGLQITAVTKSGTNRFRGSAYDIKINSDWNENSWVNAKNGDPKAINKRDLYGYSIGGPVGKPGGNNKLFFFYTHEYRPTNAADQQRQPDPVSSVPTDSSARRLLPDARQQRTVQLHRGHLDSRHHRYPAASRMAASRPDSAGRRTPRVSPSCRGTRCRREQKAGSNYNYEQLTPPAVEDLSSSRQSASTTSCHPSCGSAASTPAARAASSRPA